jgi:hypothetical protein
MLLYFGTSAHPRTVDSRDGGVRAKQDARAVDSMDGGVSFFYPLTPTLSLRERGLYDPAVMVDGLNY